MADLLLLMHIQDIFTESRETYGSYRIHAELTEQGLRCSRKRVARLMQTYDLEPKTGRPFKVVTTDSNHNLPVAPNRLNQQFSADRPDQIWLTEATQMLQRLLEAAKADGRLTTKIEILILQALALEAGSDTAGAIAKLEQALTLAEPGGYVRIFVDEGPPLGHLLYEAATRGIAPDYVGKILNIFLAEEQGSGGTEAKESTSASLHPRSSALIEPLSEREFEVLHLIAEGLTNSEIASRLFLTVNTVKAHNHNIYGKLGVNTRTKAVARARALGLLPPG